MMNAPFFEWLFDKKVATADKNKIVCRGKWNETLWVTWVGVAGGPHSAMSVQRR